MGSITVMNKTSPMDFLTKATGHQCTKSNKTLMSDKPCAGPKKRQLIGKIWLSYGPGGPKSVQLKFEKLKS